MNAPGLSAKWRRKRDPGQNACRVYYGMIGRLFDVTVIGANLSGLIAGSLLVKRGYNVLIADVKSERQCVETGGYRLGRFHNLLFGFGKERIFTNIFSELGIPFLDKKTLLPPPTLRFRWSCLYGESTWCRIGEDWAEFPDVRIPRRARRRQILLQRHRQARNGNSGILSA